MIHQVTFRPTFFGWQREARRALQEQWRPEEIIWQEAGARQQYLTLEAWEEFAYDPVTSVKVSKRFVDLAARVTIHSDPDRWALLYRVLWRLTHGARGLMNVIVDPDIHRMERMEKAIGRDLHKMRAFVRFRAVEREGTTWYVAWFEPAHHIVELNALFFADRFAKMSWSILTPNGCAHWDQKKLTFTEGVTKSEAPTEDATETLWLKYYSHIFNPARVKIHAMQAEMPKKYWKNLPEAAVIPGLLREAPARVSSMVAKSRAKAAEENLPR